jgi:hypothetical protein
MGPAARPEGALLSRALGPELGKLVGFEHSAELGIELVFGITRHGARKKEVEHRRCHSAGTQPGNRCKSAPPRRRDPAQSTKAPPAPGGANGRLVGAPSDAEFLPLSVL